MKAKYLMILFLGTITLVACKKDRVCECTTTAPNGTSVTDTDNTTYKKVTKRWMKNVRGCVSSEDPDGTKEDCEIK